jgi:hypothetical protein
MKTLAKRYLGNLILRMQFKLTKMGEALGWRWLIYNPLVTFGFYRAALRNAPPVIESICTVLPNLKTACDFGCGLGLYVREFNAHSVMCQGYEYSESYRRHGKRYGLTIQPWDLSDVRFQGPPTGQKVDVSICFEVAEHVEPALSNKLISILAQSARWIVFTAAPPGQGGTGHINEQPRDYWITEFEKAGCHYESELTDKLREQFKEREVVEYLQKNLSVFSTPS